MTSSVVGGITTTYALNGMGQRISKSGPNGTTLYLYDGAGHLLGEYDGSTGTAVQETVWFEDLPVVLMTGTTASAALYNIHADHLRAPKVITDQTGATVWNWTHGPFGKENPTGTLTYNLRFPGQYYDEETGLSYNMNRNYDAQTGRYVESDPIGLEGGINTYGYVGQNPLWAVDPLGLTAVPPSSPPSSSDTWTRYPNRRGEQMFHCGYECYLEKKSCAGGSCVNDPLGEACYDGNGCLVDDNHEYAGCKGTPDQYPQSDPRHIYPDSGGIYNNFWKPLSTSAQKHMGDLFK